MGNVIQTAATDSSWVEGLSPGAGAFILRSKKGFRGGEEEDTNYFHKILLIKPFWFQYCAVVHPTKSQIRDQFENVILWATALSIKRTGLRVGLVTV